MDTLSDKPPGADSPESCPELDDAYFEQIDESFAVIDCWEDGKNNDDSMPVPPPPISIKEEPGKSEMNAKSSSSRSRKESERSNNSESRTRRSSRDKDIKKKSRSPVRNRPFRPSRPLRSSPPGTRHRSRSPPRRHDLSPRRNNAPNKNRPSFLEEIMQKLPELQQDIRINVPNNTQTMNQGVFNPNFAMNPMMNQQMMQGVGPIGQPNFNAYPNGFQPMMDAYGQPMQMNAFVNPGINPMMTNPVVTTPYIFNQPTPVPAPMETIIINDGPKPRHLMNESRMKPTQVPEQQKKSSLNENDLHLAKKKAFESGKISMSDYLRQMSQQKSKNTTEADISSKKSKVHERCKNAANLLKDLSENKVTMPFIFHAPTKRVAPMKNDKNLQCKSPLIMSDSNARFTLQSGSENCKESLRVAVLSNPLRNISGQLLSYGRHLGLDMVEISLQIQKQVDVERRKSSEQAAAAAAAAAAVKTYKSHKDIQVDFKCQQCEKRDAVKFNTCSTQSEVKKFATISTQAEEEAGSFSAHLNVNVLRLMTLEQAKALGTFCREFNIRDNRFFSNNDESEDENTRREDARYEQLKFEDRTRANQRESEDPMNFANPENPNAFISFSPHRDEPQRPSRGRYSNSPRPDESFMRSSRHENYSRPPRDEQFSRSPKRSRITERLGKKIESPYTKQYQYQRNNFNEDGFNMAASTSSHYNQQSPELVSYRIPSPEYSREREDPRYSSHGYQHQHQHRSRSPGPSRLEASRTPPHPFAHRRGRY